MSCCGSNGCIDNRDYSIPWCPPSICCNLFKTMTDPCSQMLDRNVKRNVYGQTRYPSCPCPCAPRVPECYRPPCKIRKILRPPCSLPTCPCGPAPRMPVPCCAPKCPPCWSPPPCCPCPLIYNHVR